MITLGLVLFMPSTFYDACFNCWRNSLRFCNSNDFCCVLRLDKQIILKGAYAVLYPIRGMVKKSSGYHIREERKILMVLTEKNKKFIESVASDLQTRLNVSEPNEYATSTLYEFMTGVGLNIKLTENKTCYLENDTIYLDRNRFSFVDGIFSCEKVDLKILFHELWHGIIKKVTLASEEPQTQQYDESVMTADELAAQYFSRAMLMPSKPFIDKVVKSIGVDGMCNVFDIADIFQVEYPDVIARGSDLNLWNTKG